MRFQQPSSIDQYFETPPGQRPDLDLDLFKTRTDARPEPDESLLAELFGEVPSWLRDISNGPTRWGRVVLNFAIDGARQHQDIKPEHVSRALDMGDLLVRTSFFPVGRRRLSRSFKGNMDELPSRQAVFAGVIEALGDSLIISGGSPKQPPQSITYRREGDEYIPTEAQLVLPAGEDGPYDIGHLKIPPSYMADPYTQPNNLPGELYVANSLGMLADTALMNADVGNVVAHGRVDRMAKS